MNPYHFSLIIIVGIFSACCERSNQLTSRQFNLPDTSTVTLSTLFEYDELSAGAFIKMIKSIKPLSNGNLIVQNYPHYQVHEFSPSGKLVNTIGRKGRGPGEFMEAYHVYVTSEDSLHVIDTNYLQRQIVFFKNGNNDWEAKRERVSGNKRYVDTLLSKFPVDLTTSKNGEMMGKFWVSPGHVVSDTLSHHFNYLAEVDHNIDMAGPPKNLIPVGDIAILRTDNSMTQQSNSRFWRTFYLPIPNTEKILLISNNSNKIVQIDSSGNKRVQGRLPFEHFQVNREEIENNFNTSSPNNSKMKKLVLDLMMDHEPYYHNVVLNGNRLWIQLARRDTSKPNWIITDLNGNVIESFTGPSNISKTVVIGNKMYGALSKKNGAQTFAGFELSSDSEE